MARKTECLLAGIMLCIAVVPVSGATARDLAASGNGARESGDFHEAIQEYREALRLNPAFLDCYLGLAESFYHLDEYDEALRQAEEARKLGKDDPRVLNIQGRILLAMGRPDDGAALFNKVLEREPYNTGALTGLGEFSLLKGRQKDALSWYMKSLRQDPADRRILLSLALLQETRGEKKEAEKTLQKAIQGYPDHPLVQAMAARFYLDRNELPQALYHARTAIALSPSYLQAWDVLGRIQLASGNDAEAVSAMDQLSLLDSERSFPWYLRGVALLRQGQTEDGIASLQRAIDLAPSDEITRIVLEETVSAKLKKDDPRRNTLGEWHFALAEQYARKNMTDRAEFHFRRGLSLAPLHARGRLGWAKFLKSQRQDAAFLRELEALGRIGYEDSFVKDNREIYKSLLEDSVSDGWSVDPYLQPRDALSLRIYWIPSNMDMAHPLSEPALASYFQSMLSWNPALGFSTGPSELDPDAPPVAVASDTEAFRKARESRCDYYLVMRAAEAGQDASFSAGIRLARTGREMAAPGAWRTGNYRMQMSMMDIVAKVSKALPRKGRVLRRTDNKVLVNLGRDTGIASGDTLVVVPRDAFMLDSARPGFTFAEKDKTGEIAVTRAEDQIAEGTFRKEGFHDRMNPGDVVLLPGEVSTDTVPADISFPVLYNKIRMIH